ncbi:MAG: hypothetical protein AAB359_07010, partial [Elusimicrobiota bacterium]
MTVIMDLEKEFQNFVDEHVKATKDLRRELYLASWNFEVSGSEEAKNIRVEKLKQKLKQNIES